MIRGKNFNKTPTVHVIAFRKNADSPVQVRVTPDVLDLTQHVKGKHIIKWKLDTKGFRFPSDGSAIVFTSPGAGESFGKVKVECEGRLATVSNRNVDGLAYAYNVAVVDESTGITAVLDPVIQNNDP